MAMNIPELIAQWRRAASLPRISGDIGGAGFQDGLLTAAAELEDWARHNHPELLGEMCLAMSPVEAGQAVGFVNLPGATRGPRALVVPYDRDDPQYEAINSAPHGGMVAVRRMRPQ